MLLVTKFHKFYAYFMIFAVQMVVVSGIMIRIVDGKDDQPLKVFLVCLNVGIFVITLSVGEYVHQKRLKSFYGLKTGKDFVMSMTRAELDKAVIAGNKYVVLDNLILDVSRFIYMHPGGQFLIQHNIGKDISKFFYGAYSLEGNLTGVATLNRHSNYARMIVNDLAFATLQADLPVVYELPVSVDHERSPVIAKDIKTVCLKTEEVQESFHSLYEDDRMLGKNFRVQSATEPSLSRQYTICNVMQP